MTEPGARGEGVDRDLGQPPSTEVASAYPASTLLRVAYDAIGEAIVITGSDLESPGPRIEYVNAGFTRMTGYSQQEVTGRNPRFLQGPRTERAVLDRLRVALEAKQAFQGETVNYRKDGSEYVVEWLITPVQDAAGRVVHWVAAQRDVTERKQAEEDLRRLLHELNHRVNNTLSSVQSLAAQTLREASDGDPMRASFLARLLALSRVHKILVQGNWSGAPLHGLAEAQLGHFLNGAPQRAELHGPEVWLRPGAAVTLGLALHELAANAAAYGALLVPVGRVSLEWTVSTEAHGERLRLRWAERDGPTVRAPLSQRGFGSRLLIRGLASELRAETNLRFEPGGLLCEIDMPLAMVAGNPVTQKTAGREFPHGF